MVRESYIAFLSETYEGKAHDKRIADESELRLPSGIQLYQDTGFQGYVCDGVEICQPKKKPRGGELTLDEKAENSRISSIRVHIEHIIGKVKRFTIVREKIRIHCAEVRDFVMETCCGLHNFLLSIVTPASAID